MRCILPQLCSRHPCQLHHSLSAIISHPHIVTNTTFLLEQPLGGDVTVRPADTHVATFAIYSDEFERVNRKVMDMCKENICNSHFLSRPSHFLAA